MTSDSTTTSPTRAKPGAKFELAADDLAFFRRNGYLVLPQAITAAERDALLDLYDRDRKESLDFWKSTVHGGQEMNCDALVSSPGFDAAIRHPVILAVVERLLGGLACFSELCIRYMAPYEGPDAPPGWHRDRPHLMEHPLRIDYLQMMLYLTDVNEGTHCFSISPESADEPLLQEAQAQIARGGAKHIYGPAGTVVLFNVSLLHTATRRRTTAERKSIQIYYGHRARPHLSDDSTIPAALFRDHTDPEVRAFYGNLNRKTRLYLAAFGG